MAFLKSSEDHKTLELHIKNIGVGHAKNVNILVLHDYNQFGKELKSFSNLGAMKNGFNSFPPEYEIKYYVDDYSEIYDSDKNEFIKLKIDYKGTDNRKFTEEFDLPFNQLFGQNYSNPPETFIGQIPFYLKEINTTLKNKKIEI